MRAICSVCEKDSGDIFPGEGERKTVCRDCQKKSLSGTDLYLDKTKGLAAFVADNQHNALFVICPFCKRVLFIPYACSTGVVFRHCNCEKQEYVEKGGVDIPTIKIHRYLERFK